MSTQQTVKGAGYVLVVTLIALALSSCSSSRQQPEAASSVTPTAQPSAAQGITEAAKPKRERRATGSAEASSKSSSAAVLTEIHRSDLKEIAIGQMAQRKAS